MSFQFKGHLRGRRIDVVNLEKIHVLVFIGVMELNKIFPLSLLLFAVFIFGINKEIANANPSNSPQPFEEFFPEIGYKTVEAAQ